MEYFGGVPQTVITDNLKSAVTKSGKEATLQRTYRDWAAHYRTAALQARPRKPRDKGAVEGMVRLIQQAMLPSLDRQTFFSLDELNAEVARLLAVFNHRPFKKKPGCRAN